MVHSLVVAKGQMPLGLVDDPVAIVDLLVQLLEQDRPKARLVREMCTRRAGSRIDLASIDDQIRGFEVKSGRDDLRRLPAQVEAYEAVFDELTLVALPRHLDEAARWLPAWWGLLALRAGEAPIAWRGPSSNPNQDPAALARLLWRDELISAFPASATPIRRAARPDLASSLVSHVGPEDVRRVVVAALRARKAWRAAA